METNKKIIGFFEADKGTASCNGCNTNWKSHTMPLVCPFCGSKAILYVKEQ